MNVVLGIFKGSFYDIAKQEGNCAYPFEELIGVVWYEEVIEIVYHACLITDKIIFIIDGIEPINHMSHHCSVTCKELKMILDAPNNKLVNKVIWMEDNQIVTKERVAEKLNIPINLLGDTK